MHHLKSMLAEVGLSDLPNFFPPFSCSIFQRHYYTVEVRGCAWNSSAILMIFARLVPATIRQPQLSSEPAKAPTVLTEAKDCARRVAQPMNAF